VGKQCGVLLQTAYAAYDHVTRHNCPNLKQLPGASGKPTVADWMEAYKLLHVETTAAGLTATDYNAWVEGQQNWPLIAGRKIFSGMACSSCGSGYKELRSGNRHLQREKHKSLFRSDLMRLSSQSSTAVTDKPSIHAAQFQGLDEAMVLALRQLRSLLSAETGESPSSDAPVAGAAGATGAYLGATPGLARRPARGCASHYSVRARRRRLPRVRAE
jgi:hypothetical protein